MIDINKIRKTAEDKLEGSNLFLADLIVKSGNRIFVFLDGDNGVTIADCSAVSRHLNETLLLEEDHELVVSSFGADQPIKFPRQYNKNIGRSLTVKLLDGSDVSGVLLSVSEEGVSLKPEKKKKKKKDEPEQPESVFYPFSEIQTAKVNISFNKK